MDRGRCAEIAAAGCGWSLTSVVRIGPAARRDLDAHTLWLRSEAGTETAARFADAASQTFAKLAPFTGKGSTITSSESRLAALRKWRVDGFQKMLIFYVPIDDGIRIVRVLRAAQDWLALLDAD